MKTRNGSSSDLAFLIFAVFTEIIVVHGLTYYCKSDPVEITETSGTIRTVREGENNYDNSMKCTWIIQGLNPSDNIYLRVANSDLEWAPESAICNGYDFVEVRTRLPSEDYYSDGFDPGDYYSGYDEDLLVSWCGKRNPVTMVTDANVAVINFQTNDRNTGNYEFTGVTLDFQIVSRPEPFGGCPPNWLMGPDPTKGSYCYGLQKHELTWKRAQEHCSYNQANLVSFLTEEEATYVTDNIASDYKGRQKIWTGLNDISTEAEYKWMEGSDLSIRPRWIEPHTSNEFLNCIYLMSHNGLWKEDSCADSDVVSLVKYPFICKKHAKGNTTVYRIPDERTEKGDEGKLPPKAAIIAGVVAAFLVVLCICGAIYWKFLKSKSPQQRPAPTTDTMSLDNARNEEHPRQYSPPPSYQEVAALPPKSSAPPAYL